MTKNRAVTLAFLMGLIMASFTVFSPAPAQAAKVSPRAFYARLASQTVPIMNKYRANHDARALRVNKCLDKAAKKRAYLAAKNHSMTHSNTIAIMNKCGMVAVGEIIARADKPKWSITAWHNSAPHRAIMQDNAYTHVGMGVYKMGKNPKKGPYYFVAVLGKIDTGDHGQPEAPQNPDTQSTNYWADFDVTAETDSLRNLTQEARSQTGLTAFTQNDCLQGYSDHYSGHNAETHTLNSYDVMEPLNTCGLNSFQSFNTSCWDDAQTLIDGYMSNNQAFISSINKESYTQYAVSIHQAEDGTPYYNILFGGMNN